ncbi:MAG: hypothetical protein JNL24_00905 [Bacteroidia bacterium]|nr:hypothetical protein [Bacteroidia bacterium]
MKRITLFAIAAGISFASIAQETPKKEKENIFELQAKGLANSTWLFNTNISNTGESQDYAMGWGFNYGLGFSAYFGMVGFGLEGLMGNHTGAYEGKLEMRDTAGVLLGKTDYKSSVNLKTTQIPLMFKLRSVGGAYLELGGQYNMISGADYKRTGTNINADTTIANYFSDSYISGVLGFGAGIAIKESPVSILVGVRFNYSLTDLKGVDALGQDLSNAFIYNKYEPTAAASGGLTLGVIYRLNHKKK